MAGPKTIAKKKSKLIATEVIVHVDAGFNNTKITITTLQGDTLLWASAGQNHKGSKKGTPFAAQETANRIAAAALEQFDIQKVKIEVGGPGARDSAIKALANQFGDKIYEIKDVTCIPHNGAKPKKKRRV